MSQKYSVGFGFERRRGSSFTDGGKRRFGSGFFKILDDVLTGKIKSLKADIRSPLNLNQDPR